MGEFDVVVAAGSLRSHAPGAIDFPHRWTPEGVTVEAAFTGAHLLHLSTAGCVLNDLYREAQKLGVTLDGVRVTATGDYDRDNWHSTGVHYSVDLDTSADQGAIDELLAVVDVVAEIPRAIRAGAPVVRVDRATDYE